MRQSVPEHEGATRDERLVAALRAGLPGLLAIYRYGSAESVFEREESDIDLAVLAEKTIDRRLLLDLAAKLALLTGREVDLHDMRQLPVTLRVQIVCQGVRLFAAHRASVEEYDSRVLSDYARLNEERREILADVRARGRIHG